MEEGQREWAWKQGLEVLGLSQHLMVAVRTREQAVKGEQWMDLKYILEIEFIKLSDKFGCAKLRKLRIYLFIYSGNINRTSFLCQDLC